MADRNKAELIELLKDLVFKNICIPLENTFIEDAGERVQISELCSDDGEIGVAVKSWFYPLSELTKKELQTIYKSAKNSIK